MTNKCTYAKSGVNIDKANSFIKGIKGYVASTLQASVIQRSGAFGGLFELENKAFKKAVLVSSTDGVGTKLLIAQLAKKHDTVGIDLVAMNVNDIICTGAKPLFFLDYIACGKLDPKVLTDVVKSIAVGCKQAGCSLVGGETAEMPGMYKKDEYDLAGFAVGIVEKDKIIDGSKIKTGDLVFGLPSSGIHSNGYSLVRKALSKSKQKALSKNLLMPTRIYAKEVMSITQEFSIKGMAHITGGAYYDKLTKILPKNKGFVIHRGSWPVPKIFQIIQKEGSVSDQEMYRTFNMGIGFALVIDKRGDKALTSFFKRKKIKFYKIGEVTSLKKSVGTKKEKVVFL